MRIFIAINLSEQLKTYMEGIQSNVRPFCEGGLFSRRDIMHLTLAFIGETDQQGVEQAKLVLEKVEFEPFALSVSGIGRFCREEGDILWLGVKQNHHLNRVQKQLYASLNRRGFRMQEQAFFPHLTLARKVRIQRIDTRTEMFHEAVNQISLMRSERVDGRLIYTELHRACAARETQI